MLKAFKLSIAQRHGSSCRAELLLSKSVSKARKLYIVLAVWLDSTGMWFSSSPWNHEHDAFLQRPHR